MKAWGYEAKIKQGDSSGFQFRGGLNDRYSSEHNQVIKRGLCSALSVHLSCNLSVSCLRWQQPILSSLPLSLPFPSLLLIILSLSAHGVLTLHPLPLSLSGTADGDYGPVLPFVLGPQRDQ